MRRSNGSRNLGQEGSRRVWGSVNHNRMRQTERLQGRNSRDGRDGPYKTEEENDRNKQGYSGRFEDEDRWNHYNMNGENERMENEESDYFGPRGWSERQSEWLERGVYSTIDEDDVRSELDYRSQTSGIGRNGRGSDYMDEDHRWRMAGTERSSANNETGNENESRTAGYGHKRRRRRLTHH